MAAQSVIGSERLLTLLSDALSASTVDQTEVGAEITHQGVTRCARSLLHQTTVVDDVFVWVRAVVGKSVGQAAGNSLQQDDLKALVEQATSVARLQAPNPDFVSLATPEPVQAVEGYDEATAEMDSEGRASALGQIMERVRERGWTVSGTYLTEGRELAVVNSLGVAAYAPSSTAFLRALPDSGKGTGYADALSYRAADLDPADVAEQAMSICDLNHDQREVPPGEYEAIFPDLCVAETLFYLAGRGFAGETYEEGNSFISGKMGEQVTGQTVTIWDDATDPRSLAVAADYEGVPKRNLSLLENGVAHGAAYDTFTANKHGTHATGNAPPPERSFFGALPSNLFMSGGDASLDEMIRSTRHGLLLTRFHYTHCPDPRRVVMTGTTRDGTFLIENGEITGAVKNMRFTQSIPELFEGIEMLGPPRLCRDWWCSNGMGRLCYVCPPLKLSRATFSSGTLF
jgi:PmbA protein